MSRIVLALPFMLCATAAPAAMVINLSGTVGDGFTTLEISGNTTINRTGPMRDTASNSFSSADTFETSGNLILDGSIQDQVLALTGSASITRNGVTTAIEGLFLDDDGGGTGTFAYDDIGLRFGSPLQTLVGDTVSFSGSSTLALDISAFRESSNQTNLFNYFVGSNQAQVTVTYDTPSASVPLAATFPALIAALGTLGGLRTRKPA
ncbi:MAG: hypothetical protein AAGD04_00695 [Pseudomonadota bacterium]